MTPRAESGRWVLAAAMAAGLAGAPVAAAAGQDAGETARHQDAGETARHGLAHRMEALLGAGSRIGVAVRDVDEGAAGPAEGAVVAEVRPDSAAAGAGIEEGDVFVAFDGERVRGATQFARLVRETPPGREVAATVVRGGARHELRVTPEPGGRPLAAFLPEGALEDLDRAVVTLRRLPGVARERVFPHTGGFAPRRLGVRAQTVDGQMADYFGLEGGSGVLVTNVEAGSVAERAGLRAGDVITAFGEQAVDDVRDLRRRLATVAAGGETVLAIVRERTEMQLTAEFDASEPERRRSRIPI